jgi:delta1-piperideine-2-carboxylate reductase
MSETCVADTALTPMPFEELCALLKTILLRHGASTAVAACLARNCATAERDGALSHGLFRVAGYVSTLTSGWVDGGAIPEVAHPRPSFIQVNARNGFAQPALAVAVPLAMQTVRDQGVVLIAIRDSHHFGALWQDIEPFAREGLLALTFVSGISRVAPHGSRQPVYGTNPMAFASPRSGQPPLVFDQASSAMSYGDIRLAQLAGKQVPLGTGIDREGQPTTDPAAILDGGAILTFGGHKGSSISMMIELLAAALTGSAFSFEVDRAAYPGAQTSCSGQTLILIDPQAGVGPGFTERVEALAARLKKSGQSRLPGDHRYARREQAQRAGIPITQSMLDSLEALL